MLHATGETRERQSREVATARSKSISFMFLGKDFERSRAILRAVDRRMMRLRFLSFSQRRLARALDLVADTMALHAVAALRKLAALFPANRDANSLGHDDVPFLFNCKPYRPR